MEGGASRALVYDVVLPETGASADDAAFDVVMMALFNGKERTLAQWEALLASTEPPLRVEGVWRAGEGDGEPIVEVVLA